MQEEETQINEEVSSDNSSRKESSVDFVANKEDWIEKAIEYESTPKSLRVPKEKGEFIKSLGVADRTYYYNIGKLENKKRIVKIWLNEALNDGNEILQKLAEKAKSGDMKAIELYMKFVLELAENLDIKTDGRPIIQIVNQIATKYEATPTTSDNSTRQA
jgi:hypothetical protein